MTTTQKITAALARYELDAQLKIADLRDEIGESETFEDVSAALLELHRAGAIILYPEDNTRKLDWRDDFSAVYMSGERKDRLKRTR